VTEIQISLRQGPDGGPAGVLRRESGQVVAFIGWLDLIRALEDELGTADRAADPAPGGADRGRPAAHRDEP
jgi:hypothetical protein